MPLATLALARECDFAWIHAFRFSPRPGTAAIDMPGRVPERIVGERASALFDLGRSGKASYLGRWIGEEVQAVLEGAFRGLGDAYSTSENYLKLKVGGIPKDARAGRAIVCRIEAACDSIDESGADAFAKYVRYAE